MSSHESPSVMTLTHRGSENQTHSKFPKLTQQKHNSIGTIGGMAGKRAKNEELPDMTPKADDPPLISGILTSGLPDFDNFVMQLPLDKANKLYNYSLTQKQGDRIMAAFLNEVPSKSELQDTE